MSDSEDELDIGRRDFSKVIEVHSKEGYKEGISDGRESEFQAGFDAGFFDGLRSGFAMGQLIAIREINQLKDDSPGGKSKLPCEICKTGDDGSSTLIEIGLKHKEAAKKLEELFKELENKEKP